MHAEVLGALTSPEGRRAIDAAAGDLASGVDELTLISRLRRAHSLQVSAAIVEQARLRRKATVKLGARASTMLLLADSLEQASRSEVARVRADRLVAAGVTEVTDAGAGIGADAIAYAEAGLRVRAIERDAAVAAALAHNVRDLDVTVVEGDAFEHLPSRGTVYFDPARRADGRRIFAPEECLPPLSALVEVADRGLGVVAKMSPSLDLDSVPAGWDADWVSTQTEQGRSVVEAVLWSPPLGTGLRRAIVINGDEVATLSSDTAATETETGANAKTGSEAGATVDPGRAAMTLEPAVGALGRYVHEPDGAVSQAGLVGELARELNAWRLEPRIAYLTGDVAVDTPFARGYEVLDSLPWSKRALGRALSAYDASDLVIKKRGVTVDPTALRKELLPRLKSRVGHPLVVILTPHAGSTQAILTRPL